MSSFTDVVGPAGPQGIQGIQGIQGVQGPAGVGAVLLAHSETVYSTYMIAGEQQLASYTIPAGTLKAGDRVRFTSWSYGQNPTSQVFYTHRWKFGSTIFMTSPAIAHTVGAGLNTVRYEMEFQLESLTSVRARAWILVGGPSTSGATASAVMVGDIVQYQGNAIVNSGINFANATTLVFTTTPDRTLGDAYYAYAGWYIQHFPA